VSLEQNKDTALDLTTYYKALQHIWQQQFLEKFTGCEAIEGGGSPNI